MAEYFEQIRINIWFDKLVNRTKIDSLIDSRLYYYPHVTGMKNNLTQIIESNPTQVTNKISTSIPIDI